MNQRTAIHVTGTNRLSTLALVALAASELSIAGTTSPSILVDAKRTDDPDGTGFKKTLAAKKLDLSVVTGDESHIFVHQPAADSTMAYAAKDAVRLGKDPQSITVKPAIDFGRKEGAMVADHLLGSWIHEGTGARRLGHSTEGTQLKRTAWPGPALRRNQAGTMVRA